jgi:hypothetical protein
MHVSNSVAMYVLLLIFQEKKSFLHRVVNPELLGFRASYTIQLAQNNDLNKILGLNIVSSGNLAKGKENPKLKNHQEWLAL